MINDFGLGFFFGWVCAGAYIALWWLVRDHWNAAMTPPTYRETHFKEED